LGTDVLIPVVEEIVPNVQVPMVGGRPLQKEVGFSQGQNQRHKKLRELSHDCGSDDNDRDIGEAP